MGRKPKELDYDTVREIIRERLKKQAETYGAIEVPTAQEITREYNDRRDESVHHVTVKNYLERDDRFAPVRVADYTGWTLIGPDCPDCGAEITGRETGELDCKECGFRFDILSNPAVEHGVEE